MKYAIINNPLTTFSKLVLKFSSTVRKVMAASIEFKMPQNNPIRPNLQAKKKPPQKTRSRGQLEHRSSAILPFSAWVEPHRGPTHGSSRGAREEELRLKKVIKEKEERLKEFQQEVKARVRDMEQIKREEQHGMSVEAFEVERNVVQQSSLPSTVRRDNCVYRDESELKIQRSVTRDFTAVDTASQLLDEHAKKIRNCSNHARKVLSSKSLGAEVEHFSKLLPGGLWRTSPTKDHGMSRQPALNPQQQLPRGDSEKEIGDYWIGENAIQDQSFDHDQWIAQTGLPGHEHVAVNPEKHVQFETAENLETENKEWSSQQQKADGALVKTKAKSVEVLLQPSKLLQEKRTRAKSQVAVYRRLFMDIEREQVRENIRMREHRKRMETLKVEKEVERLEIEQRQIDKLKMQRVRKEEESFLRAQKEKKSEMDLVKRHKKLQKEMETERYIEALQAVLKDKVRSRNIVLPPLCSCGPTIWDTNPDTCANNCVFHKNPKAYAKALSTVLASSNLD